MHKYLFIDRDGTIIAEPEDFQIDSLEKLELEPQVIPALLNLQAQGFRLVMVSNQDGLGTDRYPLSDFQIPHDKLMQLLESQGIYFDEVLICPHFPTDNCSCRKPKTKLIAAYLEGDRIDPKQSYVIGDRKTDLQLAQNIGIEGIRYDREHRSWVHITNQLCAKPAPADRTALVERNTKETQIKAQVWLDREGDNQIQTGIGFFDHMLDQIAVHGGLRLHLTAIGDLHIDDHHTIEDTAITLGLALKQALGDKRGVSRFGMMLPMDECLARCALDLSGRPYLKLRAEFTYEKVGDFSTNMTEHFFRSLAFAMDCTLHLKTTGQNDHHRIESLFKAFGRSLRQAIRIEGNMLPSSKGTL